MRATNKSLFYFMQSMKNAKYRFREKKKCSVPWALIKMKNTTELSIYSLSLYKTITYEYECSQIKINKANNKKIFSFVKKIYIYIYKETKKNTKINHFKC